MAKIKTFTDYDSERLDNEINDFLQNKKLIDIKTNVIIEPANAFIDNRGFSTAKTYTYIVIYKEKTDATELYKKDNQFMQEYFKNNPL